MAAWALIWGPFWITSWASSEPLQKCETKLTFAFCEQVLNTRVITCVQFLSALKQHKTAPFFQSVLTFEMCSVCDMTMLFYIFINSVKSIITFRYKRLLCEHCVHSYVLCQPGLVRSVGKRLHSLPFFDCLCVWVLPAPTVGVGNGRLSWAAALRFAACWFSKRMRPEAVPYFVQDPSEVCLTGAMACLNWMSLGMQAEASLCAAFCMCLRPAKENKEGK